jgi:integrase/recombinase XerC
MQEKIGRTLHVLSESCHQDLKAYVQKWHEHLTYEKHASAHTIYNYLLDFKSFFEFLNNHLGEPVKLDHLAAITLSTFRSFLAHRVKTNSSAISNKRALSALKNLYAYLGKHAGVKNIHLDELTSPKAAKTLPRPMSQGHAKQLLDLSALYSQQPKWVQSRDEAVFMLLYGCGLRITEALNLNVRDINAHSLRVLGKRNKERVIPMLEPVHNRLKAYMENCPIPMEPHMPLFLGIKGDRLSPRVVQKQMEKIRLALGMPATATPHSLRHSFASHLLAGGADLRSIQELMGHDSLTSTQVYTKLEDQALFETYLNAHPRARKAD